MRWIVMGLFVFCILFCGDTIRLSHLLQNAAVTTNVVLDGQTFETRDGRAVDAPLLLKRRVLALAFTKTAAERTPPLSLDGTDPEKLAIAVGKLLRVQDKLAGLQENPESAALVSRLYPVGFLQTLATLEASRRSFIASGSVGDLGKYTDALTQSLDAYDTSLQDFSSAFEAAVPEDVPEYATVSSQVSRTGMQHAIELLKEENKRIARTAARRSWCTHGFFFFCRASDIDPPEAPSTREITATAETEKVRQLYLSSIPDLAYVSVPVAIEKGACTATLPGQGIFLTYSHTTAPEILKPLYLGDIRLIETSHDIPFYTYFGEQGIDIVPSPTMTHYSCPEFSFEFAEILAAVHASSSSAIARRDLSSDLDSILIYLASVENNIMNAADHGAPAAFDPATLFFVRSGFLATFLAHNRSISRVQTFFDEPAVASEEQPFVMYSGLSNDNQINATVRRGIKAFDAVHQGKKP